MNTSAFPGQTLQPLPANSGPVGDDEFSLLQKIAQNTYNASQGGGGGGGAPSGPAGGDLSGTYPNPAIAAAVKSLGGNGTADSGKLMLFGPDGGTSLGKTGLSLSDALLRMVFADGNGAVVFVETLGTAFYIELQGSDSTGFHAHVPLSSTGNHTGFDADLTGGTGVNTFAHAIVKTAGLLLYGEEYTAAQHPRFAIRANGNIEFYADGTTPSSGTDKTILAQETPSGTSAITVPAETGRVSLDKASTAVSLTADNQVVTPGKSSVIQLSSDDPAAGNRTFTLSATGAVAGRIYVLIGPASNACEIVAGGVAKLSATWTPTALDTLTLLFDGTNFLELARSNN